MPPQCQVLLHAVLSRHGPVLRAQLGPADAAVLQQVSPQGGEGVGGMVRGVGGAGHSDLAALRPAAGGRSWAPQMPLCCSRCVLL